MKKILCVSIMILALFVSGCGEKSKEGKNDFGKLVYVCNINSEDTVSEYKVYATDDIVSKVVTTETVTSDDEEELNQYKEFVDAAYKSINNVYGGYDYEVKISGNKLISKATIDYNKMDLEKYVSNNYDVLKNYVTKDKKFDVDGITKFYEDLGAKCSKEK